LHTCVIFGLQLKTVLATHPSGLRLVAAGLYC